MDILLWLYLVALCIHVLDESTSGQGFVDWVKHEFWPEYNGIRFFYANTIVFILHLIFIIVYEAFGGVSVILPLITAWLFTGNGFCHWIYTLITKKYSPGLITSPIYWIIMYFIIKQELLKGDLDLTWFVISLAIGGFLGVMSFGSFYIIKLKQKNM